MSEEVRAEIVGPGRVDVVTLGTTPVPGAPGAAGLPAWKWQGVWSAATAYILGPPAAVVRHAGILYIALANSTAVEPGVTTGWATSWDLFLVDGSAGSVDLSGYQQTTQKGAASGYAPLGVDSRVPAANLPAATAAPADDVAAVASLRTLGAGGQQAAPGDHLGHLTAAATAGVARWIDVMPRVNPHLVRAATATPWRSAETAQQDYLGPFDLTEAREFALSCFVGIFNHSTQAFSALGTAGEKAAVQFCRVDVGFETSWQTVANWRYLMSGTTTANAAEALPMDVGGPKRTTPGFIHADARKLVVLRVVGYSGNNTSTALVTGPLNLGVWE
ncbi:MAG: hypothetical protein M3524_08840 [Actinomycetota bacterium]|nr:hypothetical protein [Actinomycetota bacterium]